MNDYLKYPGRFALALLGAALAVISVEVSIRIFDLWRVPDYGAIDWYGAESREGVPYLLKRNLDTRWEGTRIISNSYGLRDMHPPQKPAGVSRILAVGDSITFGFGLDSEKSFPARLENILNSVERGRYEVINAGIPGFNLKDVANLVPSLIERYSPDLVVWLAIPNDFDDSFGVTPEGRLRYSDVDYVVSSDILGSWGFQGGYYVSFRDFRSNMSKQTIRWAENLADESFAHRVDAWLSAHSVLWSFVTSKLRFIAVLDRSPKDDQVEYVANFMDNDGGVHPWLSYHAVYSSSKAHRSAAEALSKVRDLCSRKRIPLALLNTALPLEKRWMQSDENYRYIEVSAFLREPFASFLLRNNLGWDGHLSDEGTFAFAQAIAEGLRCNHLIPDDSCATTDEAVRRYTSFWSVYDQNKRSFIERNYGSIRFDTFAGIPQLLGGTFPPREFPGHLALRANFLFPPRTRQVRLSGRLQADKEIALTVRTYSGINFTENALSITPGMVDRDLLPSQIEGDVPLELELICVDKGCGKLHLSRLEVR